MNDSTYSLWKKISMNLAALLAFALVANFTLHAASEGNVPLPKITLKTALPSGSKVKLKITAVGEVTLTGLKNAADYASGKVVT